MTTLLSPLGYAIVLVSNVICTGADKIFKALFILYSTFAMSGVHNGTGQHAADIPTDVLPVGLKVRNSHWQDETGADLVLSGGGHANLPTS